MDGLPGVLGRRRHLTSAGGVDWILTEVLGMALNALTLALNHRLAADVERYEGLVDLRVAPPLCNLSVSPADFSHADELIARACAQTRTWLTGSIRSGSSATVRP